MKLSDVKGEKALEMTAELLTPIESIFTSPETLKFLQSAGKKTKFQLVAYLLKQHKHEILQIMAILNEQEYEEYCISVNMMTLPVTLLEILNDKELQTLFLSQGQTGATAFGSVLENIGE